MRQPEPTISTSAISRFVSEAHEVLDSSPQMNESNTKFKLIEPFLQNVLGWDRASIDREYTVSMATSSYNVDYALSTDELPEVFVEAKGSDTTLEQHNADQLQDYLRIQEVPWGLLTNGQQYRLYQMDMETGSVRFHLIADATLDTLSAHRQAFSAISQPAIETGDSESLVQYIRERNQTIQALKDEKQELADQITDLITTNTSDIVRQSSEQEAKSLIDRLIERLQTESQGQEPQPGIEEPPVIDELETPDLDEPFPELTRDQLPGNNDALVGVYASSEAGVEFLREYQAWGFISIARQPEYFMIYLTRPYQHIRYFGTVKDLVPANEFVASRDISPDEYQYDDSKKVVIFSELYRLTDPLPIGTENPHRVQGLMYTTIGKVKVAESIDDL